MGKNLGMMGNSWSGVDVLSIIRKMIQVFITISF